MATSTYILDPAWERERERLEKLTMLYQPETERFIDALGICPGWRCLEVGGGTGGTAAWLCSRVAPDGKVVATDLDTRFLDELDHECLEVLRHDIVNDEIPVGGYDLIHARLLLEHLPARREVVARLAAALKPGGWLVAEDFDFATWGTFDPPAPLHVRVKDAVMALMSAAGHDPETGTKLPGMMIAAGLEAVEAAGHNRVITTGTPGLDSLALMLEQFREMLLGMNLLSSEDIDEAIADIRGPANRWGGSPLMVTAWGRRPL
jgi:SAM-dependent methyltransferase